MVDALTVVLITALFSLKRLLIKYRDIEYVRDRTELMKFHRDNDKNRSEEGIENIFSSKTLGILVYSIYRVINCQPVLKSKSLVSVKLSG